jgi:hypothetical protein
LICYAKGSHELSQDHDHPYTVFSVFLIGINVLLGALLFISYQEWKFGVSTSIPEEPNKHERC